MKFEQAATRTLKLVIPKRLDAKLQRATEQLKVELEDEERTYPSGLVRKAVERAFNDLGDSELLPLIGRAYAILLDDCTNGKHSYSESCKSSTSSSGTRGDSDDSEKGRKVAWKVDEQIAEGMEEKRKVTAMNGSLHASPISIQTSTPKAISDQTTPLSSPSKPTNPYFKSITSPYRNNMSPYKMNISIANKTGDQASICEQRVINESNVFNRSIAVADRSNIIADYFKQDSKVKRIVAYIMWRTGLASVYEDDVIEAVSCFRNSDFIKWRDAAYEAWTHILPVSIKLACVLNNLFVGSLDSGRHDNFSLLKENTITHLVVYTEMPIDDEELGIDLVKEFQQATEKGLIVFVMPQSEYAVSYYSYELLAFIHEGRRDDRSVAILCDSDGMAAAGSILTVYLMLNNDRDWDIAMQAVKGAHEDFAPVATIEDFAKRANAATPFPDEAEIWRQKMRPSCDLMDDPVFQADEPMFQGCLRDCQRWYSKMQKCVKANGEKAKKEKKMLEDWMAVQQYFDDESTEQDRERRKSANFSGFDLPASEFGRSSRANSFCGSPARSLFIN